jgi:hypothetical protein
LCGMKLRAHKTARHARTTDDATQNSGGRMDRKSQNRSKQQHFLTPTKHRAER